MSKVQLQNMHFYCLYVLSSIERRLQAAPVVDKKEAAEEAAGPSETPDKAPEAESPEEPPAKGAKKKGAARGRGRGRGRGGRSAKVISPSL